MKIEQRRVDFIEKPKIIDPLNEIETIKDVMLFDGKIEEIGIIDAENDINFTIVMANSNHGFVIYMFILEIQEIKKH